MAEAIVLRLYYEGEEASIPARQALVENVLPAIKQTGKWRVSVAGDTTGVTAVNGEELGTGNIVTFTIEEVG